MPELPEVETVRRTLNQLVAGKRIERVTDNLASNYTAACRARAVR